MSRPLYEIISFKGHQERGKIPRKVEDIDRRKQTMKEESRLDYHFLRQTNCHITKSSDKE